MKRFSYCGLILALVVTTGCVSHHTLYDDLGGADGIDRIAARFIAEIGQDEVIRPYFEHTNLDRFYTMFSQHLCEVVEGPCTYSGDPMVQTHIGMGITEAHFNVTVDLLINAMNAEGIPHRVQNRLLSKLAPMRGEIIYQ